MYFHLIFTSIILTCAVTWCDTKFERPLICPPLSIAERVYLAQSSFKQINSLKKLPRTVREAIGYLFDFNEDMADRLEQHQTGCASDPNLPKRHFESAAISNDRCIINYHVNRGACSGIVTLIFARQANSIKLIACGECPIYQNHQARSVPEVMNIISKYGLTQFDLFDAKVNM